MRCAPADDAIHVALSFSRPQTLREEREIFICCSIRWHPPRPPAYRTLSPKWRTAEYKYAARKSGVAGNTIVEGRARARGEEADLERGRRYSAQPCLVVNRGEGRKAGRAWAICRAAASPVHPPSLGLLIDRRGGRERVCYGPNNASSFPHSPYVEHEP